MTLDVLSFIDNKGGNAEEIRESQRKRGHSVELVDEIIQMYADWVKSAFFLLNIPRNRHLILACSVG
jgi:seryl-tRNA synthetase